MPYTVVWVRSADDELADIWLESENRDSIVAAVSSIDSDLRINAEAKGTALSEGLRALNMPPIRVIFTIRPEDYIVEVLCVRRI